MKAYKLKHIPTGLYFTPSKSIGNLSKKGKVYIDFKPRIEWTNKIRICGNYNTKRYKTLCGILKIDYSLFVEGWRFDVYVKTNPEEWVIEELL